MTATRCGRDPREEPRPGDQVCVAGETREVAGLFDRRVQYSWPGKIAGRSLSMIEWRRWASQGEVVEVAP